VTGLGQIFGVLALLVSVTVQGATTNIVGQASGTCVATIVQSKVNGNVTLNCGADREDLRKITDAINALIAQNKLVGRETAQLLSSVNELLALKVTVASNSKSIERIFEILQGNNDGNSTIGQVRGIVKETLDRAQQKAGPLKVTLTRIEGSYGSVVFYFEAVNEGIQEERNVTLFGSGGTGGGSTIYVRGQQILASGINLGGTGANWKVTNNFVPGVPLVGAIQFKAHVDVNEIQVLRLGISQNYGIPQTYLTFRIAP
jgi:hypothetical protein